MSAASRAIPTLLVDDSPVARRVARLALAGLPGCTIVGEASRGTEALTLLGELQPAVVVLDLDLPGMSGLDVIGEIMATRPTPIVVMSGHLDGVGGERGEARELGSRALAAGAVVLVAKARLADERDFEDHADELRRAVALAGRARVITHPRGRPGRVDPRPVVRPAGATTPATAAQAAAPAIRLVAGPDQPSGVLVIGASTGGPAALAELLGALPGDLVIPVLVVQHMSQGFMEGLASWLDKTCALPVAIAVDGQRLRPGTVSLAPDGANTELDAGLVVRLTPAGPRQFHVPSVDLAFASAARVCGASAVGVLLTGMGRDGAAGLGELRATGALTLAQDEASSVVWGMPGAAVAVGAAERVLPLHELAGAVLSGERPVPA